MPNAELRAASRLQASLLEALEESRAALAVAEPNNYLIALLHFRNVVLLLGLDTSPLPFRCFPLQERERTYAHAGSLADGQMPVRQASQKYR